MQSPISLAKLSVFASLFLLAVSCGSDKWGEDSDVRGGSGAGGTGDRQPNFNLTDSFTVQGDVEFSEIRISNETYVVATRQKKLVLATNALNKLILDSDVSIKTNEKSPFTDKIQIDLKITGIGRNKEQAIKDLEEIKTLSDTAAGQSKIFVRRKNEIVIGTTRYYLNEQQMLLSFPNSFERKLESEVTTTGLADQTISSLNPLILKAELGDIYLSNSEGNTKIQTGGLAGIYVFNHIGNLELKAENGKVEIEKSKGNAKTENKGLSDVDVTDLNGDLEINTSKGNVNIFRVTGKTKVSATGANIHGKEIDGFVDITTRNLGDIKIKNLKAGLTARTENGRVEVSQVDGKVDIATGGLAEIKIKDATGDIKAVTDKGNIFVDASSQNYQLETNGLADIELKARTNGCVSGHLRAELGDIDVSFSEQSSTRVICSSEKGKCKNERLPLTSVQQSEYSLDGILRNGQCQLRATTGGMANVSFKAL